MTLEELAAAVTDLERRRRIAHGLPPDHLRDLQEFPFAHALEAVGVLEQATAAAYAAKPHSAPAIMQHVLAVLALKQYAAANTLMEAYQSLAPQKPKGRMRFGLAPGPASISLPPIIGEYPKAPGFFLACDEIYFRLFCLPLLKSIAAHGPGTPVHVHLLGGNAEVFGLAKDLDLLLSTSHEPSDGIIAGLGLEPRDYFGAVRLIRFAEALEHTKGPLWTADVDGLVTGNVRILLAGQGEAAMRVRAGRLEPWNQYSACLVMGTEASRPYFQRVADILRADLAQAWWGMDQYALFSAALGAPQQMTLLGPDLASVDENEPGLFWFTAGAKKSALNSDQNAYAALYRKYT